MNTATPVHLAAPPTPGGRSSGDIIPHKYVLMKHSQICATCGTLHESNDLYVQMNLAPRFAKGRYIVNLVPLSTPPQYRLPIEVRVLPTKTLPFCCECANANGDGGAALLAHLPLPPEAKPLTITPSWAATGRHPDEPQKAPKEPASPKREAASAAKLADLLSQI